MHVLHYDPESVLVKKRLVVLNYALALRTLHHRNLVSNYFVVLLSLRSNVFERKFFIGYSIFAQVNFAPPAYSDFLFQSIEL